MPAMFSDVMKDVTMSGVHVRTALTTPVRRKLTRYDDKTAKTPFQYHGSVLAQIRPDQVPRVLAALTDAEQLEMRELPFDALTAVQNRVDAAKTLAIAAAGHLKKPAVVVHIGGARNLIMDGHHRLAADWLNGRDTAMVRYKDVGRMSNALKGAGDPTYYGRILKVDESHGLVLGYAIVCKRDGKDYFDLQGDHIPEDAMLGAAVEFMLQSRAAKEMHAGDVNGKILFAWPLTTDIAKAFGIETATTGLMIAMKPDDPAMLAKFRDGTYTGFSIGGSRMKDEIVDD
jgi:Putative phage serine protease XkdF